MGRATISWLNGVLERAKGVWLGFSSAIVTDTRPLRPLSASTDVRNRKGLARQYTARTWERVRTTGFLACQWFAVKARLAAAEQPGPSLWPGKATFTIVWWLHGRDKRDNFAPRYPLELSVFL
jgi:hypothetical protein